MEGAGGGGKAERVFLPGDDPFYVAADKYAAHQGVDRCNICFVDEDGGDEVAYDDPNKTLINNLVLKEIICISYMLL